MNSISDEKILDLIGSLYDSVREQSSESWFGVFTKLSGLLSSGPGSLSFYAPNNKRFELFVTTLDKELFEEYNSYYQFVTPFRQRIQQMTTGDRFNRAEHFSDKAFLETEIYREYFSRQDVFNYEYRVLFKQNETVAGITFSRPEGMRNFGVREYRLLDLVLPHLQKAFQIYLKFAELQRENEILSECFERISQALIVLDKTGKAIYVNESAKRLINAKDGLQIEQNGILAANLASDSKKLRTLVEDVFEPSVNKPGSNVLQISRSSGLRPLSVFVAPFSGKRQSVFQNEKLALLCINDPEHAIEDVEPLLQRIYRLTPAESKIAAILAQGKSVNEACEMLGIRQNTIRTHLKRIFSKTETNRQSELVKLIVSNTGNVKIFCQ